MNRVKSFRAALACAVLAMPAIAGAQSLSGPVQTQQGKVQGAPGKVEGVTVFKGIPFAAPPVGDLRWAQPQQPVKWNGVRDATKFGDVCVQPPAPQRFPPNGATDSPNFTGMSEDCLTLNIWTPAKKAGEKLPVMVWLYGGAYNEGGGNAPFSEGDNLAAKGVVMVTFNYRVGPFGFFSHPELTAAGGGASGNQALGDSIAVFKWLKENVAQFGGDPNNITLFGESAGAAMNGGLVGAAGAKGTFERAIAQSGAWMGLGIGQMPKREDMEKRTLEAATKINATSLAALRALPAEDIAKNFRGQGMIVDGKIITEDLSITFANGRQNKVDVISGSNANEGSFTSSFGPPTTLATWTQGEGMRWGSHVDLGRAAYPATTDAEAAAQAPMPFSDTLAWHMRLFADSQAKTGNKTWTYWFTHEPPYDEGRPNLGAGHTAEIPYAFDNLAAPRTYPAGSSVTQMAGNAREEAFADQVSQYWVNFARTGNPNGPGLPHWPSMAELGPNETMILDADNKSGKGPWITPAKSDLFQAMYDDRVATPLGIAAGGD
ncbi:carboxylesterase/lipase family protein [Altererythrobacter sp. Root672]|uniref:carboxylesterase/lipase family protein n=1 Tax=Altererythrobacter sp. Root672 TaxID=1736584 RepID=UPI0009EBADEA|nr:carboxylesterase family protein [Altererythrobacter sp. Root672]